MGGGDLRKVTDLVESWAVQVASCSEIGWVGPDRRGRDETVFVYGGCPHLSGFHVRV